MKKNKIRLNESQLRNVIKRSVKKVLKESAIPSFDAFDSLAYTYADVNTLQDGDSLEDRLNSMKDVTQFSDDLFNKFDDELYEPMTNACRAIDSCLKDLLQDTQRLSPQYVKQIKEYWSWLKPIFVDMNSPLYLNYINHLKDKPTMRRKKYVSNPYKDAKWAGIPKSR